MKQSMHGLSLALVVTLCASRPFNRRAQDVRSQESKPLDKTVTLKADHERLEDVLDELEKKGYFTFSYQSDILKKDRLVTLTIKESTLREALELILGRAYDYVESDNYVVIRRRDEITPRMKKVEARTNYVTPRTMMMKSSISYAWDSGNITALRQRVRNIINEMITDGIVKDKDSFTWFGLDDGQFIVDGNHLADSLRVKYAAKYVKDGNGYYYGSVSVQGHGYFFDKNEIYGDGKQ